MRKKTGYVSVRLTLDEHELIRATARRLGLTMTDFVVGQALLIARGGSTADRITARLDALEAAVAARILQSNATIVGAIEGLRESLKGEAAATRKSVREEARKDLQTLWAELAKRLPKAQAPTTSATS
jgi:hypothetical protein